MAGWMMPRDIYIDKKERMDDEWMIRMDGNNKKEKDGF